MKQARNQISTLRAHYLSDRGVIISSRSGFLKRYPMTMDEAFPEHKWTKLRKLLEKL